MTVLAIFFAPVQYFRMAGLPNWAPAVAAVAVHAGFTAAAVVAVEVRLMAAQGVTGLVAQVAVVLAAAGMAIQEGFLFALAAGAVVVLDAVFSRSGKAPRLVEFTGIAHVTQIPWALLSLVILAGFWAPPAFRPPPDAGGLEALQAADDYARGARTSGLPGALTLIRTGFGLWLALLQGCALRVVSGFTVAGAWAAGSSLAFVLAVAPWALQRLGIPWTW